MKADFLSNWKLRQVDAAGVAVVIIGLVSLYLGGLRPVLRAKDAAAARSSQISMQEDNAQQLHDRAEQLKLRLAEVREALAACPVRLEPAGRVNERIARLTDLGAGSGLKIDEINPDVGLPAGPFDLVPMRLFGSGSYRMWAAFLHELTATFPDMCVDSFELTAGPGADAPAQFRIRLLWCASPSATSGK